MIQLPSDDVPVGTLKDIKERIGVDEEKPSLLGFYVFDFGRYLLIFGLGFLVISASEPFWRPFEKFLWEYLIGN